MADNPDTPSSTSPPQAAPSISQELKKQIAAALEARGATLPCPRCGNNTFSLLDGYFFHSLQTRPGGVRLGGAGVPVAVVACNRCGFLAEHALGALGLLSKEAGE